MDPIKRQRIYSLQFHLAITASSRAMSAKSLHLKRIIFISNRMNWEGCRSKNVYPKKRLDRFWLCNLMSLLLALDHDASSGDKMCPIYICLF